MKKIVLFCCLLISLQSVSQSNWKQFWKLSSPKKIWVITHVFKAKKAYVISKEAQRVSDSIAQTQVLDGDTNGGQVDAFRHAYWMVLLHQTIGEDAAKSLGKAHERENKRMYRKRKLEDGVLPDKISSQMDLYNNNIGLSFTRKGEAFQKKGLIFKVINAILAGKLKIIKKDSANNYLTCSGEIIDNNDIKYQWKNNKCLISSDKK